jgi:hypothetical protein
VYFAAFVAAIGKTPFCRLSCRHSLKFAGTDALGGEIVKIFTYVL